MTRLTMATIGRGGGRRRPRIRDEILAVQQPNNCKGGMMAPEASQQHIPDDVPIYEALLKFIAADCDINVYWDTARRAWRARHGVVRPLSEPSFKPDQYEV